MSKLIIKSITTADYQKLINNAEILERDTTAPKVLKLADGTFLKLFRRKRWFSSELVYPYVKRFADNALILQKLGIATPEMLNLYRFSVDELDFTAVHYQPLPGETLRQAMQAANDEQRLQYIKQFAELLAKLHQQGVYFRSIHLGNVLVLPDNSLGLIDFADMTKQSRPLSQAKRARNLKHMQRYKEDAQWLFEDYFNELFVVYKTVAGDNAGSFLKNKDK